MPNGYDENGLDFYAYVKQFPFGSAIPVVIFSGNEDAKIQKQAFSQGVVDYVKKPIIASQLIQKARKYLKDASYSYYVFSDYLDNPQVFHHQGEILQCNQECIEVETNIKIARATYLIVQSPFCTEISFPEGTFTTGDYVRTLDVGKYTKKLYFLGAHESILQNIKKLRLTW